MQPSEERSRSKWKDVLQPRGEGHGYLVLSSFCLTFRSESRAGFAFQWAN